ncbi:hypothetical protein QBC38DRAFT_447494 [Podospora fimiseda]|uniref:Uncharacterized protein n=1 Tax=Podospora fimiseda TaxID=252190 RepID=A0AAN7BHD0_9PEZI|nr:hypothetical protein QBC38DRAFT_447494 [Podospora fimiseda]
MPPKRTRAATHDAEPQPVVKPSKFQKSYNDNEDDEITVTIETTRDTVLSGTKTTKPIQRSQANEKDNKRQKRHEAQEKRDCNKLDKSTEIRSPSHSTEQRAQGITQTPQDDSTRETCTDNVTTVVVEQNTQGGNFQGHEETDQQLESTTEVPVQIPGAEEEEELDTGQQNEDSAEQIHDVSSMTITDEPDKTNNMKTAQKCGVAQETEVPKEAEAPERRRRLVTLKYNPVSYARRSEIRNGDLQIETSVQLINRWASENFAVRHLQK